MPQPLPPADPSSGSSAPPCGPTAADGDRLDTAALAADLKAEARRLGFSRVGIAPAVPAPRHDLVLHWLASGLAGAVEPWFTRQIDLRSDPRRLLPAARSVVLLATDHATGPAADRAAAAEAGLGSEGPAHAAGAATRPGRGRVARYAWGDDYHDLLRDRVNRLAAWLAARAPGCQSRGVVDSAPLAEREFAWLAGLGWFGKNTLLIDPAAGSYFLLTALLTDLDLPVDTPLEVDHCGTCTACLDACPTQAFVAPRVLDAGRCISSLTIEDHGSVAADLRQDIGDWIFGCDVCQEVCPWNRRSPGSAEPSLQPRGGEATLPLTDLLGLDEHRFRTRFKGSPLLRAKRRGLLRSAAIALGNRPDSAALPVLVAAVADAEPVVRSAAAWALGRWLAVEALAADARAALEARLMVETEEEPRREIARALSGD
jgi:epoxyqueuosine reductase